MVLLFPLLVVLTAEHCAARTHSLRYFRLGVSEPGHGIPEFISVGYVDSHPITTYDSVSQLKKPQAPWMAENLAPDHWERYTQLLKGWERTFTRELKHLQGHYNHSGFHTYQRMIGCELRADGSSTGFLQYAYDGQDFLVFDKDTLSWIAVDNVAHITKRAWEANRHELQYQKNWLEEECIAWLKRFLEYGKDTLQRTGGLWWASVGSYATSYTNHFDHQDTFLRLAMGNRVLTRTKWLAYSKWFNWGEFNEIIYREAPLVRVHRKETFPGITTLFCRAHGFYPPEISMIWMKNGKEMLQEMDYGDILPSGDGTYQTWVSLDLDPQSGDSYSCHVEHCDVHMVLQVPQESETIPLVMKAVTASVVLAIGLAGVGVLAWRRRLREQNGIIYLPTSDQ